MSRPIWAHVNNCMQVFSGVKHAVNEQHVTLTSSRIERDNDDTHKVFQYIEQLNVLERDSNFRNAVTEVTYGKDLNQEMAEEVGSKIVSEMAKKIVTEFSSSKSKQVKPMKSVNVVSLKEDTFIIEPGILFQHLLFCAQTSGFNLKEVLCYELCTHPASLFDKCGHMREAGKSQLARYICEQLEVAGCTTKQAEAVADVTIVAEGVASAQKYPTAVIVYDIKQIREKLGEEVYSHMIFAHAMLGCDTTSKPFRFGKSDTIKLLNKNEIFKENAAVFKSVGKTEEEIQAAGHVAMDSLCSGCTGETLDEIRLRMFTPKATKSTSQVKPEVLPPTKDASALHSLRVYHQVQQ
ncbi:hypothetical protein PR048_024126 [Dryococelus australis]|uniref:Uncharacterized protein n=1 Tax=Dryococelus australis TaxID=614101 RepID=A0ABQ9GW46_9NEOP|nr:hypothetical protein PR048_024126 [Dryococelus australis]